MRLLKYFLSCFKSELVFCLVINLRFLVWGLIDVLIKKIRLMLDKNVSINEDIRVVLFI